MANNTPSFSRQTLDAPVYVVNQKVNLPAWVKCQTCGKGPTPEDWLKPMHPDEKDCHHLIHLSHIPNAPELSKEAGWIARNA
jgi:hypothetical protein